MDYDALRSAAGLDEIATYADGIGPWIPQLYRPDENSGELRSTGLVEEAQARGLAVHPYTARADDLPPGVAGFEELHHLLFGELVDGIFTDFPDRSKALRQTRENTATDP